MTRKLQVALAFLLLLLVVQSMVYAGTGQEASQSGTTQAQASQSNEQAAGFDNRLVYEFRSEVTDLMSSGMLGFMLGASIVGVQTLRRRALAASARTIALNL